MKPGETDPLELERQALEDYHKGRLAAAIGGLRRAQQGFDLQGQRLKSAETANSLCVVLLKAGKPREALECVRGTPEVFAAQGNVGRTAQALGNLASALEGCGDWQAAEDAYRQAADKFAEAGDEEQKALTMRALSTLQLRRARPLEAVVSMQAGTRSGRLKGWIARVVQRLLRLS